MDGIRVATIVSLLAVAIITGGAAVRLAVAVGDTRVAVGTGLVTLVVAAAVVAGARGRRWRQNPYW